VSYYDYDREEYDRSELRKLDDAVRLAAEGVVKAADEYQRAFMRGDVPEYLSARNKLLTATSSWQFALAQQAKEGT
jgi:hypothetical protein